MFDQLILDTFENKVTDPITKLLPIHKKSIFMKRRVSEMIQKNTYNL